MIRITRMDGRQLYVNCDLIEWIEATPDTTIKLQSGKNIICSEKPSEVINRVIEFRRRVLAPDPATA